MYLQSCADSRTERWFYSRSLLVILCFGWDVGFCEDRLYKLLCFSDWLLYSCILHPFPKSAYPTLGRGAVPACNGPEGFTACMCHQFIQMSCLTWLGCIYYTVYYTVSTPSDVYLYTDLFNDNTFITITVQQKSTQPNPPNNNINQLKHNKSQLFPYFFKGIYI